MKLKAWLLSALAPLTAVSVLAQVSNSAPPAPELTPPPAAPAETPAATNAPAHKPAKPKKTKAKAKHSKNHKASEAKKAPEAKNLTIVLTPPVTAAVKCNVLDVRGQGSFNGEVITHLNKGENVTVLEEITLAHPKNGEPAQWSQIIMPTNAHVWVFGELIDETAKTVKAKKANVRGGPGENFSVVARIEKGTPVNVIDKKGSWVEIEPPTNAVAFVASEYLEKAGTEVAAAPAPAPAPEPTPAPAPPPTAPTVVENAPPPAVAVTTPPPAAPAPAPVETAPVAPAPTPASQTEQEQAALHRATAAEPMVTPPAPAASAFVETGTNGVAMVPRVVTREGILHRSYNPITPADFELRTVKSGELFEYVQPPPKQNFKKYVGARVRIVGTELLDSRWQRTPVLQVESIERVH